MQQLQETGVIAMAIATTVAAANGCGVGGDGGGGRDGIVGGIGGCVRRRVDGSDNMVNQLCTRVHGFKGS